MFDWPCEEDSEEEDSIEDEDWLVLDWPRKEFSLEESEAKERMSTNRVVERLHGPNSPRNADEDEAPPPSDDETTLLLLGIAS